MKLSIITVVLNDKDNIEKTILSVINQKVNLEYIIIDGGSTDGTLNIIEKYQDKIDVFVSEKDKGIVDAFNKGLKQTSGDIIGLLNSGDYLEDEALLRVEKGFEENSVNIVYGDMQYWDGKDKTYVFTANHTFLEKFMSVNHAAVFIKKEVYIKHGLFNEKYKVAMDYELMLRFYMNGARFKYINRILSNMSLGGVSDVSWKLAYRESYEVRKEKFGFSFNLYIQYLFQILKRYVGIFLLLIGLDSFLKFYRNKFAKIKKYD